MTVLLVQSLPTLILPKRASKKLSLSGTNFRKLMPKSRRKELNGKRRELLAERLFTSSLAESEDGRETIITAGSMAAIIPTTIEAENIISVVEGTTGDLA